MNTNQQLENLLPSDLLNEDEKDRDISLTSSDNETNKIFDEPSSNEEDEIQINELEKVIFYLIYIFLFRI